MPEDIQVKLSPLDEESRAALMSFVDALKEVKDSIETIKNQTASQITQLQNIVKGASQGSQVATGGVLNPITNRPFNESGKASSSASTARVEGPAAPSAPPTTGPTADSAGYGSTAGGGGMGDNGSPYASAPSSMPGNAPSYLKNSQFYGQPLNIPRINQFNLQDYSRMAGKVIAGPALGRYQANYQNAYKQSIDSGMTSVDAADAAHQSASANTSTSDVNRFRAGRVASGIGQIAPYTAATHGLIPQLFTNGGGFSAAGLSTNITSSMGLSGQQTGMVGGTAAFGADLFAGAMGMARPGYGNEAAYRFGETAGIGGRGSAGLSPREIGLFNFQERGAFAEASTQVNMRGNEFDAAFKNYSTQRASGAPTLEPGQYIELSKEQTRQGSVSYQTAAKNLNDLAAAAKFTGMNVKQMGDAVQSWHANNPQQTMAKGITQVTAYGNAGINPDMADQIANNPLVAQLVAQRTGSLPSMVSGMNPQTVLSGASTLINQIEGQFRGTPAVQAGNGMTSAEKMATLVYNQTGITAETQTMLHHTTGEIAAAKLNGKNISGMSRTDLRKNLNNLELPNFSGNGQGPSGGFEHLSQAAQDRIMRASPSERANLIKSETSAAYGYDVSQGNVTQRVANQLSAMISDSGAYSDKAKKFVEQHPELHKMLEAAQTAPTIGLEFTGAAKNWFQQVGNNLSPAIKDRKPSATDPQKRPNNMNPSR